MYRSDKQFMKDPATASSRIYIGNISETVLAVDLEQRFNNHGKILGLVLQRGFGFIQYEKDEQAQTALRMEHGSLFFGRKLNVRQAVDKTRLSNNTPQSTPAAPNAPPPAAPANTKPLIGPQPSQKNVVAPPPNKVAEEMETPMEAEEGDPEETRENQHEMKIEPSVCSNDSNSENDKRTRNRRGGNNRSRDRDHHRDHDRFSMDDFSMRDVPPPRDLPHRDLPPRDLPHRDLPLRDLPPRDLPPRDLPLRDFPLRDLPPRDLPPRDVPPYYGREEHYRPGPAFAPPAAVERPDRNDCEIIVVSKLLTEYAEYIEKKLKSVGLLVDLLFPNEDVPIGRVLANISSRGCLYAILVMPQNEEYRSLTLNILHGLPQEHRNMPIDDAVLLITRNFDAYMRGEKTGTVGGLPGSPSITDRHPEAIQMLLNLLAENRQITTAQYDRLLKYLQERRELQLNYEIGEGVGDKSSEVEPNSKQAELQSRIMNILNKSADEVIKPVEAPVVANTGPTPLLNDPSVQKALDSLLSGDMFKTISSGF